MTSESISPGASSIKTWHRLFVNIDVMKAAQDLEKVSLLGNGEEQAIEMIPADAPVYSPIPALKIVMLYISQCDEFLPLSKLIIFTQLTRLNRDLWTWADRQSVLNNCWVDQIIPIIFQVDPDVLRSQSSTIPYRVRFNNTIMLHCLFEEVRRFHRRYEAGKAEAADTCCDGILEISPTAICCGQVLTPLGFVVIAGLGVAGNCFACTGTCAACCMTSCVCTTAATTVGGCYATQKIFKYQLTRELTESDLANGTHLNQSYEHIISKYAGYTEQNGQLAYIRGSKWSLLRKIKYTFFQNPPQLYYYEQQSDCVGLRDNAGEDLVNVLQTLRGDREPSPPVIRMQ